MTTYRVLAAQQGDVQLRCTHHLPPPAHAFILAALEQDDVQEYGQVVVFTLTLTERQTDQGALGQIEVQLSEGTLQEWAGLPILPPLEWRREEGLQA